MIRERRNLYIITAAEFVAILGFSIVTPFLPYYVQELGASDPTAIKLWSGLIYSLPSVTLSLASPLWGTLADRFGRKVMVERAMFGGALVIAGMGLTNSLVTLSLLRALQGMLTGTIPAATSLVASNASQRHTSSSIGLLQAGVFAGASMGPLAGGLVTDSFGYRAAFWFTSACLLIAGLAIHVGVSEQSPSATRGVVSRDTRFWEGLLIVSREPALRSVFTLQMTSRVGYRLLTPLLPLFIQQVSSNDEGLGKLTGLTMGSAAFASALGALVLGRASERIGHRRVLASCFLGMAITSSLLTLVTNPQQLIVSQVGLGFLIAGVYTSIASMMAMRAPKGRLGAVFGLDSTVVSISNAIAPLLAASIAVYFGIRSIFLASAAIFAFGVLIASLAKQTK